MYLLSRFNIPEALFSSAGWSSLIMDSVLTRSFFALLNNSIIYRISSEISSYIKFNLCNRFRLQYSLYSMVASGSLRYDAMALVSFLYIVNGLVSSYYAKYSHSYSLEEIATRCIQYWLPCCKAIWCPIVYFSEHINWIYRRKIATYVRVNPKAHIDNETMPFQITEIAIIELT